MYNINTFVKNECREITSFVDAAATACKRNSWKILGYALDPENGASLGSEIV
jgi:hypothetical protein